MTTKQMVQLKKATDLLVNEKCWFEGKEHIIVGKGEDRGTKYLVVVPVGAHILDGRAVPVMSVEPVITEILSIGDRVGTGHVFEGVVTGFESDTNRAICLSDKNRDSEDRKRYAYKSKEIHLLVEEEKPEVLMDFEVNGLYWINEKYKPSIAVQAHYFAQKPQDGTVLIQLLEIPTRKTIAILPAKKWLGAHTYQVDIAELGKVQVYPQKSGKAVV